MASNASALMETSVAAAPADSGSEKGERMLCFSSSSGDKFTVTLKAARLSKLIDNMLNDTVGEDDEPIPFDNVNSVTLKRVIAWMEHHRDDIPEPTTEESIFEVFTQTRRLDNISEWDKDLLDISKEELHDITNAANFMDIADLMLLCCKIFANIIKDKPLEEVRDYFDIDDDIPDDVKEKVIAENKWLLQE
jgi:S-phase kinase-associated protein 1